MRTPAHRIVFAVGILISSVIPIAIAYEASAIPLYALSLLIANSIPIGLALLINRKGRRGAAWGWLLAITAFGAYIWISVTYLAPGSTAAIAFVWIPVWNIIAFGPIGATLGHLLTRWLQRSPLSER